jgi:SAM-dependent methyltransferase
MCGKAGLIFGRNNLLESEVCDKLVIEVGSYDVNGSLRADIEKLKPVKYWGVDILKGKGVDEICNVKNLINRFGKESFDIVITTELLEHVRDWRAAIHNIKNIIKPNGILLLTTRSFGFEYHGHPFDFWRYEIEDMKKIFSDFTIVKLENDPSCPGVFLKAVKSPSFIETDYDRINLYSIVKNKRSFNVDNFSIFIFRIKVSVVLFCRRFVPVGVKPFIKKVLNYRTI